MTTPASPGTAGSGRPGSAGAIDLSQNDFWALPLAARHEAFTELRALDTPPYFPDPETPFTTEGQGFYAFVRHADVLAASRQPEVFSSARGSTSLVDLPPEFNEYFGSPI